MLSSKESFAAVRFEGFELDLHSGELRRDGTGTIRLPEQSFQILAMLLEHAGKVVSRREIQRQLWPDGTVVEFEHSIGAAINRLRQVLGDSAENARYIETLTRRGYRWIAGAEWVTEPVSPESTIPVAIDRQKTRRGKDLLKRGCLVAAVAVLVLLCTAVWSSPHLPKVTSAFQLTNDGKAKIDSNLFATDGVHLYFMEGTPWGGGSAIAQVSAIGGESTRIETPLREMLAIYAISPDFSELLVANGIAVQTDPATGRSAGAAEVWAQPLPAGTPHRVGNIYASAACYTPDGMGILYADGDSLMTINRDGSNPHELARVQQGVVRGLRYSPDGKRIRFQITIGPAFDNSSLWEIDANGNNLHALLPNWKESPFQCCGNWSAGGKYYFFQAGHGNDQAIWVMPEHRFNFVGGPASLSRLISGPLRLSVPVPSADGKKLFVIGQALRVEPVRYDSKTRRFESYLNGLSTNVFEFSADRKWIAYVSYPDMSLWRSRVDGTDKMQLTFAPVRAYGPQWSPDGSQIVFMDVRFGRPWTVSLISSSGSPPQSYPGGDPNWLPDGRSFIYVLAKPDDRAPFAGIFRRDLDSGKISSIPNSEGRYSARVSPNGRYIAFSQAATELLLFDSKTNRWSSLANGELFSYNLWSHHGKYVYMRDYHAGSPRIVRVRIQDARMEEVVSLKDRPSTGGRYVCWLDWPYTG
jgi:DNA-binding winged helix-turn-helix (wHTH) protein/Tol biopolymer transport system component